MLRTIVNLDPFAEFQQMSRVIDRMFGDVRQSSFGDAATFALPVDLYEKDNTFFVRAAVPGVSPEQLDVEIQNNVLTIKGETKQTWEEGEDTKVYHREYRYGSFSRSIRLPERLDLEKVDAEFKDGFVTISIPRVPEVKPQALKVSVRSNEQRPAIESKTPEKETASKN
jgi:HSP20 family protein